jgi:HAD superfamily hydrolase (TIGR01509 family)
MRAAVRGVLFDLDDTLFDHAHATREALAALQTDLSLFAAWPADDLVQAHGEVLEEMHREVLAGRLSIPDAREARFRRLLLMAQRREDAGDDLGHQARDLARGYREAYERAWRPVPGAVLLLAALKDAGHPVAVVTNNVRSEQELKLSRCGLDRFVDVLVTSEGEGVAKPAPAIFIAALRALDVEAAAAVMVGDAWDTDIVGALAAGVQPVWFNRRGLPAPSPGVSELTSLEPVATVMALFNPGSRSDRAGLPAQPDPV